LTLLIYSCYYLTMSGVVPKYEGAGSEQERRKVIHFVRTWIDARLTGYVEPQRSGTAKGDRIGFSKKKLAAAALLALYPQVQIKEIAEAAGVKAAVLSVWRTHDNFRKKETEYSKALGEDVARMIVGEAVENHIRSRKTSIERTNSPADRQRVASMLGISAKDIEDDIVSFPYNIIGNDAIVLQSEKEAFERKNIATSYTAKQLEGKRMVVLDDGPNRWTKRYAPLTWGSIERNVIPVASWFNALAAETFVRFVEDYLPIHNVLISMLLIHKYSFFWDDYDKTRVREWITQKGILKLTKTSLLSGIETLADPDSRKAMGDEEIRKLADFLKSEISNVMDILAS
jgi:hypothetical protein